MNTFGEPEEQELNIGDLDDDDRVALHPDHPQTPSLYEPDPNERDDDWGVP